MNLPANDSHAASLPLPTSELTLNPAEVRRWDDEELADRLETVPALHVAELVSKLPDLAEKSRVLWALEDAPRREVLDQLPAPMIAALIQNLEEDNRYLLGDLSLPQYRSILALCAPQLQFYWITSAVGFTDLRANTLPLLLSDRQLSEALSTRVAWRRHLAELAEFPLHAQRIPPEMMLDPAQGLVDYFGREGFLRQFPVDDPPLARFAQNLLDFNPERYGDLIRLGLSQLDYQENHPHEWEHLAESPVLVPHLEPLTPTTPPQTQPEAEQPVGSGTESLETAPLATLQSSSLASLVPMEHRSRFERECSELVVRQAIALGGSFLESELQRIGKSVEAYIFIGLKAESGEDAEREPTLLATRAARQLHASGERMMERVRQVVLRLLPLQAVLDSPQFQLVRSLEHPRLTLDAAGTPQVLLRPGTRFGDSADLAQVTDEIHRIAHWAALARGLGLAKIEAAFASGTESHERILESLAIAALLFDRVDLDLAREQDLKRLASWTAAEALDRIQSVFRPWAEPRGMNRDAILSLFDPVIRSWEAGHWERER